MAAITPVSIQRENVGSLNLLICKMKSIDTGDTYATNHSGIAAVLVQNTLTGGTTGSGLGICVSDNATGTLTFTCALSDNSATLYLLVRD